LRAETVGLPFLPITSEHRFSIKPR
jgi:hypothetical protein